MPIYTGDMKRVAYDVCLQRVVDQQISHAQAVLDIRDAACSRPQSPPTSTAVTRSRSVSSRSQTLGILTDHPRCLDHIAKCTPFALLATLFVDFDMRHRALQRDAMRVPADFPSELLDFLDRAPTPSAAGAGARPVSRITDAALTGAYTAAWPLVSKLLGSTCPTGLCDTILLAAGTVTDLHRDLIASLTSTSTPPISRHRPLR